MATVNTGDNRYGVAQLIVAPTIAEGANYSTIATAITAASSGQTIFIRPGTYTENLTLKAGVNLVAFSGDGDEPNVIISGTCSFASAGTCTIANIRLQTNGATNILAVTGSAASIVNLEYCYLNCTANTGISFTTANTAARVNLLHCKGDLGTTGITYFVNTSTGGMLIRYCDFTNTGSSTTASSLSAGQVDMEFSIFQCPITTTSTGILTGSFVVQNLTTNTTALTIGGSTASQINNWYITSGSASAISVGAAGFVITQGVVNSSNTNAITGAGTVTLNGVNFGTSVLVNTTTQIGGLSRTGINLSDKQPAFLAYLPSTDLNKTGNGSSFTLGSATALTEVFDQNSNFVTSGTFTAPYTGKYFIQGSAYLTGCTINVTCQTNLITSNRTYSGSTTRTASATDNQSICCAVADFDAADTMTVTVLGSGEGGATDDVFGAAGLNTYISGYLLC